MKSLFTVYSQRLAGYLMMNGLPLVKITQASKTGKDDYLFANTDTLHNFIDKWKNERSKQQNNIIGGSK